MKKDMKAVSQTSIRIITKGGDFCKRHLHKKNREKFVDVLQTGIFSDILLLTKVWIGSRIFMKVLTYKRLQTKGLA